MKELLKVLDHFQSPGGFFILLLFVRIVLNACFSAVGKVQTTKLYAAFWDVPIPRCVPIVFWKLLNLWFWSYLFFC